MDEILLVDKPEGITSFQLLGRLQRELHGTDGTNDTHGKDDKDGEDGKNGKNAAKLKLGHAGTLDPMASGLMVVGVGAGTKKLKDYVGLDKTYEAEILLGVGTDSGDVTGEVIAETQSVSATEADVQKALGEMVGTLRLPVSKYSAMKQGGEPLYKKARAGKKFIIPFRDMEVRSAQNITYDKKWHVASATFEVGSGTYIRSLAEELGRRLDVPATLKKLRRTKVGEFSIDDPNVMRS